MKHPFHLSAIGALVAIASFPSIAIEEGDFLFGDNVGEIQFNQDPLVAVLNQASRSGTTSSPASDSTFFGEFDVEFLPDAEQATSIVVTQKARLDNISKPIVTSGEDPHFAYVLNKIFFEIFDPGENITQDTLNVDVNLDVHANDPSANVNDTFLVGGSEIDFFTESQAPFYTSNGFFFLDSQGTPSTPQFGGSYLGNGSFTDNGGGDFTVMANLNTDTLPVLVDTSVGIDVETFLQVTNLQTFGGTETTILNSTNTFVMTITANNAATRFRRVQKDGIVQPDGIIQGKGQNRIARRPIAGQTFRTFVSGQKRVNWRVENNGPDVNLEAGPRSIRLKGPTNSSRQRFLYFNKSTGRTNITGLLVRGRFVLAPHAAGQGDNIEVRVISKRRRFGSRRLNSFNLDARTPVNRVDVNRLQVISQ